MFALNPAYKVDPQSTLPSDTGTGSGSSSRSATAIVHVFVRDVDDNTPRFDRDHYAFMVAENLPPGTSVGRVAAVDLDLGPSTSVDGDRSGGSAAGQGSAVGRLRRRHDRVVYSLLVATRGGRADNDDDTNIAERDFAVDPRSGNVTTKRVSADIISSFYWCK